MPPPYFTQWCSLYAALEAGPNFPTALRIHVPDTIFFNDHKFPEAWYGSSKYRLKQSYPDHLNIPRVVEQLLKKAAQSSTFALHYETFSEFISKREFLLRAKSWLHTETRHPKEIPWVLQMYNIPVLDKTSYFTSYLQPGVHPFSIVTHVTAVNSVARHKQQTTHLKIDPIDPLMKHSYQVEIGGANLSLRDPLFLRMKRLTLHLVSQVEKCKDMSILGKVDVRCLVCEFLTGQESTVQLINVLGYHLKGREASWNTNIDSNVYENRVESYIAKKINMNLYTESHTPKRPQYTFAPENKGKRQTVARDSPRSEGTGKTRGIESKEDNGSNASVLTDPEVLKREEALTKVFYKIYKNMKKNMQRPIDVFKRIDTDESGTISGKELRVGLLKDLGFVFSDEEFQNVVACVDADGSGEIEYKELSNRIKNSDPKRRERMKARAIRRDKAQSDGLKSLSIKAKTELMERKIIRFSKLLDSKRKVVKIADKTASTPHKDPKVSLPINHQDSAQYGATDKEKIANAQVRAELEAKNALLLGAQKLVQDLYSALGDRSDIREKTGHCLFVPEPPETSSMSKIVTFSPKISTPLTSRISGTFGRATCSENTPEMNELADTNQKLLAEVSMCKEKLKNEREIALGSMRRNEDMTRKMTAKIKSLEETNSKLQVANKNITFQLEETQKKLFEANNIMNRRTNAVFKKTIANLKSDKKVEERDIYDPAAIEYITTQHEPILRWLFLTYASKETGQEYMMGLDDAKQLVFDAGIVSIDAPKLSLLYRRSNSNSMTRRQNGISFLQFVEFVVRLGDEIFHRTVKLFSDRLLTLMEEHLIPLANLTIGDAADDV